MKRIPSHPPRPERPHVWRSLGELENTPAFQEALEREFSEHPRPGEVAAVSKRDFLRLMGASVVLGSAGLTAGCRRPESQLVPFNRGVEWSIPGKNLYYATSMPTRRGATPLIVTTVDGRPIKLEGNPHHPNGSTGTDGFGQASILDLYDPHRARVVRQAKMESNGAALTAFLESQRGAKGLAFLVERNDSPTRDRLRTELEAASPDLLWCEYEPLGSNPSPSAAAFGPGVELTPRYERADVILALDSDFLSDGESNAAGFFTRRNPDQRAAPMNRLYVVENHFSPTGGIADHRYRCKASFVGEFARRIAARIVAGSNDPDLAALLGVLPQTTAHFDEQWIEECTADLLANIGRAIVVVGSQQPAWVQALVLGINQALGSFNATILGRTAAVRPVAEIEELARAIREGKVQTLFVLGGNPAYNAPADLNFAELLAKVPTVVRLGLFEDETSRFASWNIPAAHYLESWSDTRTADGTYSSVQPMILPLWNGWSELDVLAILAGHSKPPGPELVQATFSALYPQGDWTAFLRNGFLPSSAWPSASLAFNVSATAAFIGNPSPVEPSGVELVFLRSSSVDDGRYANNSWLQEAPDFVTKLTWDNAVLVSPVMARTLGLRADESTADMVEIRAGNASLLAAAVIAPGHADDSASIALGYGRSNVSALMEGVGFDAYPLRESGTPRFRVGVSVTRVEKTYPLARTQEHQSMEGRDLFRQGTRAHYESDPEFVHQMGGEKHSPPPAPPRPDLNSPEQWGMAVDLNTCIGCNACLVACRAENNVPVVGKDQVRRNRDMAWIRIDRYFAGSPEQPEMYAQPVMCQHCENAPCETVCPVNATVHNEEGLNLMVYNRCIGTRYCANNCPWKVRRFNYFDYNERPLDRLYEGPLAPKGMAESLKMVKNPNVTVRMRGVMEKCTFCIQRIESAKIARTVEAGPRDKRSIPLRPIQTACQQACPSGSFVFGNINDPNSRVARLRLSPRSYFTLEHLNARPRVNYLARIKNPNPRMPQEVVS